MWSPDRLPIVSWMRLARLLPAFAIATLCAGCFQPLYGDHAAAGKEPIVQALRAVDVLEIKTPRGTRIDRVGFEIRNNLLYSLTGGHGAISPNYRLSINLKSTQSQIIVDASSGRPDVSNYGIDANYTLTEIATGKVVLRSVTSSQVSYNIPGQQQRFAGERGLRDAENRAATVIADTIRNRLASYFAAGT
jgi:LPS-assembly lipoprotein